MGGVDSVVQYGLYNRSRQSRSGVDGVVDDRKGCRSRGGWRRDGAFLRAQAKRPLPRSRVRNLHLTRKVASPIPAPPPTVVGPSGPETLISLSTKGKMPTRLTDRRTPYTRLMGVTRTRKLLCTGSSTLSPAVNRSSSSRKLANVRIPKPEMNSVRAPRPKI